MSEWQPIETAPKDGTEVIGIAVSSFPTLSPPLDLSIYGPWTIAFRNKKWESSWDEQEVIDYMSDARTEYKSPDLDPTHWMPLPEPPKVENETQ